MWVQDRQYFEGPPVALNWPAVFSRQFDDNVRPHTWPMSKCQDTRTASTAVFHVKRGRQIPPQNRHSEPWTDSGADERSARIHPGCRMPHASRRFTPGNASRQHPDPLCEHTASVPTAPPPKRPARTSAAQLQE